MPGIDTLFDQMLTAEASNLHMQEGQKPKLRIHGRLLPIEESSPLERKALCSMLQEICSPERWNRFEHSGDLDFAYSYRNLARFRVNYQKHYRGYGAVFRTIPSRIQTLEQLGAPEVLKSFADFGSGLCLITGPTGCGKSTTLAALIDHINSTQKRTVLTIEEPVEFVHEQKMSTIIQREVGTDVGSFSDGLRGALRQDVDVVLVGEMRDLETINLAVTAAEMGLLVFGTVHTNSATKTIDRLIDVFPAAQQDAIRESLAVALRAVCAQLLLRKPGGKGRIAAYELLIQTRAISNLIREAKTGQLSQVMMSSRSAGMTLMDDVLESMVSENVIEGTEAYMKALDKERFVQFAPKAPVG